MTPASLDAAVTDTELEVIFGFNHGIGNLDKNRLEISSRFGDTGGLDVLSALVISGAATCPGDEILDRRERGHNSAGFGDDGDSRHGIRIEARDGANPVEDGCIGGDEAVDFSFDFGAVLLKFVDVVETLAEFNGLLMGDSAVHGGLNLGNRGFAAPVNKRRDVKRLPRMCQDMLGDGT